MDRSRKVAYFGIIVVSLLTLAMLGYAANPPVDETQVERSLAVSADAGVLDAPPESRPLTTLGPSELAFSTAEESTYPADAGPSAGAGPSTVVAINLESGFNPFYDVAPVLFGFGVGPRSLFRRGESIGFSASIIALSGASVRITDQSSGVRERTLLLGAVAPIGNFELSWRLGNSWRFVADARVGMYLSPRPYPLFALGVGFAMDFGGTRVDWKLRLQRLPTHKQPATRTDDLDFARSIWTTLPVIGLSLPLN